MNVDHQEELVKAQTPKDQIHKTTLLVLPLKGHHSQVQEELFMIFEKDHKDHQVQLEL